MATINARRRAVLAKLIIKQGGCCFFCREPFGVGKTDAPSLDHYIPRCNGGFGRHQNKVAACKGCNKRKGPLHGDIYLEFARVKDWKTVAGLRKEMERKITELNLGRYIDPARPPIPNATRDAGGAT